MAIREQKQRVFRHGGDGEHGTPLSLPARFSTEGTVNFRIRKDGLLESVRGYSKANSSATTTDTGADATKVTGVVLYKTESAGSVTRNWVKVVDDGSDEVEIWHSTDGGSTWTFLKDLGSTYVGLRPSFAQYDDELIIAFGEGADVAPQLYDGSSVSDAGPTQPSTPSTAASSTGGLLNGTYTYKVAIIDSNGEVGPASDPTTELVVEDLRVDLTSIPTGPGGTKGRRLFRTLGDGGVYFRLADIDDNAATTFEDNVSDRDLIDRGALIDDSGEAPPTSSKIVEQHQSRIIYKTGTNQFSYSDPAKPDSVGSNNFERVGEGLDGDEIVGFTGNFEGELIVWKQHSIWRLAGRSQRTFNIVRTQASIGAINDRVICRVPAGAVFPTEAGELARTSRPTLAFMAPDATVRLMDGLSDTVISSPKQDTLDTLDYSNRKESLCFIYRPYRWVVWGFPSSGSSIVDTFVAWDYSEGSWHEVDHLPNIASVAVGDSSSATDIVFAGEAETATGGFVYQLFDTTAADGSNFTPTFRSKPLHFGEPDLVKVLTQFEPIFEAQGASLTPTVNFYTGYADSGASAFSSTTVELQGSNENYVTPDPIYPKNTSGAYPRSQAHIVEITLAGQTQWALAGWTAIFQVEQDVRVA